MATASSVLGTYPVCSRCGHPNANHSTSECTYLLLPTMHGKVCDCTGWQS